MREPMTSPSPFSKNLFDKPLFDQSRDREGTVFGIVHLTNHGT